MPKIPSTMHCMGSRRRRRNRKHKELNELRKA
jgi:hypothetical protein